MFVELGRPENEKKEHTGTHKGHAKERAGITKDTKGHHFDLVTSTALYFRPSQRGCVCPHLRSGSPRSYRIGLVIVAVPSLLADSSSLAYDRSFGREGVTAAGAQRGLIGSRNHVCDLRDQDAEEITGIGSDLEIAAIAVHRHDSVPVRMGEPGVHG